VTIHVGLYSEDWTYYEGCPDSISSGGGGSGKQDLKDQIVLYKEKADSTENLLFQLVDGGSTEELQQEVDMSTPPESMDIYNELMNNSPFLSDTVVGSAIYKEAVLPNAMLRDIMVANPQSAKNDALMNKIDDRWDPMPDYMKSEILEGRSIVAAKEKLESELSRYRRLRSRNFNNLIGSFMNDTTLTHQEITDSLVGLFENETDLDAKYRLGFLYSGNDRYEQGLNVINSISGAFDLNNTQEEEYQSMNGYFSLLEALCDSSDLTNPDSLMLSSLYDIYINGNGLAVQYARNILLALNEIEYEEPIILPFPYKTGKQEGFNAPDVTCEKSHLLIIYPNPSNSYLIIEYEFEKQPENALVVISEAGGKRIKTVHLNKQIDQKLLDIRDFKQGMYIATLFVNRITRESVKFTIIH